MLRKLAEVIAIARRLGISWRTTASLFVLDLLSLASEVVGIALLLPIFELLRAGGTINSATLRGRHWDIVRRISADLDIPITFGLLLTVSFLFILLRQFFTYLNARSYGLAKRNLANQIRRRVFYAFLRADMAMQDRSSVGAMASGLTVELDRALSCLFAMVRALGTLVKVGVYVFGLLLLSLPMTVLSLAMISVAGFFAQGLMRKIKDTGAAITEANLALTTFVVERLTHARLIRLSGTEKAEAAALAKLSSWQSEQSVRQKLISTRLSVLPEPIAIGFSYIVVFLGGEVFGLGLEGLGLFVIVLIRLMPIVRGVITDYSGILSNWPSALRLNRQLTRLFQAQEAKGGARIFVQLDTSISFEHVSFSYGASHAPALRDVTVSLRAHAMTALIGPSGAGKSTFVDLLPRLRDPTAGKILFDGIPLTEFSMSSLRAGIAFVPQQPQIFDITAAEHIRYGKEDARDAEVREAAKLAGALDFIEALPDGFATPLGDGGRLLSGGQRQRLDIARALVRCAPILILDEPTSALDAEAESAFRDALRTLRAHTNLTIIVIAHRLSTIIDADQIIVLRHGRVEGVGNHSDLLAMGGWYAKAFEQQQLGGRTGGFPSCERAVNTLQPKC